MPTTPALGVAVHRFAAGFNPVDTNSGSATGVGDIILRAKWHAYGDSNSRFDAGVLAQAQLATGDEADLLGTGSNALAVVGVVSAELGAVNPHLNLGYEHFFDQDKSLAVSGDAERLKQLNDGLKNLGLDG